MHTESEIRDAQAAIAFQIKEAEKALEEAKRIANKYDLPFSHELVNPVEAEKDWDSSSERESYQVTDWQSSSQNC